MMRSIALALLFTAATQVIAGEDGLRPNCAEASAAHSRRRRLPESGDRMAKVILHTVKPAAITDPLDGTTYATAGDPVAIDIGLKEAL